MKLGAKPNLAGFHAAQALISERTGRSIKTHNGVKTEFHRLVRNAADVADELRDFLDFAYNFKAIADYETGPGRVVTPELATEAIGIARRFVATVVEIIAGSAH